MKQLAIVLGLSFVAFSCSMKESKENSRSEKSEEVDTKENEDQKAGEEPLVKDNGPASEVKKDQPVETSALNLYQIKGVPKELVEECLADSKLLMMALHCRDVREATLRESN